MEIRVSAEHEMAKSLLLVGPRVNFQHSEGRWQILNSALCICGFINCRGVYKGRGGRGAGCATLPSCAPAPLIHPNRISAARNSHELLL